MDPLHAAAARYVTTAKKSAAEDRDAFYDDHGFETLHAARRALAEFARLLRIASGRSHAAVRQNTEFARLHRRA